MKKIRSLFVAGLFTITALAQQDIQFTQFMNNKLYYNPGVAGTSGSICINAVHRSQWVGFENAPTTQNINAEIPVKAVHGAFLINITNDQIGFFRDIKAGIGYSFNTSLAGGVLGLGIQVDFINKGLTDGQWIPPDGQLGNLDPNLGLLTNDNTTMTPELNFGAYFTRPDFYVGISSSQLLSAKAELQSQIPSQITEIKGERHYFLMGGYNWDIPNTAIQLQPAILAKTDLNSPVQLDINASALYNNRLWGGLGYRLQDAFSVMLGYYILPNLRLSYSYDLTTSALQTASSGSHEVMVNYCFKIVIPEKEPGYYRNPRFL